MISPFDDSVTSDRLVKCKIQNK